MRRFEDTGSPALTVAGPSPEHLQALEAIRGWTRQRFRLAGDAVVLVSQLVCHQPGCPPLETAIAYWTEDEKRHQFKLSKAVLDIVYDDLGWLIVSPAGHDGFGWDCC